MPLLTTNAAAQSQEVLHSIGAVYTACQNFVVQNESLLEITHPGGGGQTAEAQPTVVVLAHTNALHIGKLLMSQRSDDDMIVYMTWQHPTSAAK